MAALTDPGAVLVSLVPSLAGTELPPLTVDRAGSETALRWLDPERAVLEPLATDGRPDHGGTAGRSQRVLLLPPIRAPEPGRLRREVVIDGWRIEVEVEPAARAALRERARRGHEETRHSGPTEVHAIIPGVVLSVSVAAGDDVAAGQELLTIEAMKMQNELRAPRSGRIERVAVAPGGTIDVGDLLVVII